MRLKYEHTQRAGLPFYFVLIIAALVLFGIFTAAPAPPVAAFIVAPILLLYGILFVSSLTVTLDDQYLRVRFGPGVFFKKFLLSEISTVGSKYNSFVLGWGIRWYITGWLYNIAGFKSVEIVLKNGKKRRIGTDEPEQLAQAIREAIEA